MRAWEGATRRGRAGSPVAGWFSRRGGGSLVVGMVLSRRRVGDGGQFGWRQNRSFVGTHGRGRPRSFCIDWSRSQCTGVTTPVLRDHACRLCPNTTMRVTAAFRARMRDSSPCSLRLDPGSKQQQHLHVVSLLVGVFGRHRGFDIVQNTSTICSTLL